ncbi:MAG: response regulator [bacterium]|nr:response regulator [bacterium]
MKFLIVEDSKMSRKIIINTLRKYEYEDIVEAENGEDALTKVENVNFVITDWNMPVMEGLEFVKKARAKKLAIPILMISTNNADLEIEEALQNGVDDYIVKPFLPPILKEKIDQLAKKYEIE